MFKGESRFRIVDDERVQGPRSAYSYGGFRNCYTEKMQASMLVNPVNVVQAVKGVRGELHPFMIWLKSFNDFLSRGGDQLNFFLASRFVFF